MTPHPMTFRVTRRLAPALLLFLLAVPARSQDRLGIDLSAMDRSVRPQDDLFRYTNGRWVETTLIPADRGRYGAFDVLGERARDDVRAIIDDAVSGRIDDPDARKIGALYQAFMDSARVERLGVTPLAEAALATVPGATILADAGYDCESNHGVCRERLGVRALIPAKTRRYVAGPRRPYRAEMVTALGCATLGVEGQAEPRRIYRQRWLVETLPARRRRRGRW